MQSNLVLTANFAYNRFLATAGTYYGLFSETDTAHAIYFYSGQWGSYGVGNGQFLWSDGITLNSNGIFM